MDEDQLRGLLQSANDQAAAMLDLAKVLKDKMGKDDKRDWFGDASKVIKQPEMFSPKNQEEELMQWQDWRLGFRSWLFFAQEEYRSDLDLAEQSATAMDFIDMTFAQHGRAERLHSILIGLLRGRVLKILRSVEDGNGLEAWRELNRQTAPRTRARSIALLQAFLNHPPFVKEKTVVEQVLGLERLAEEYHTVAKEEVSDNTKLSVLLKVVTPALRQHLQLSMDEAATFAPTREKVINYERTTTSWNSAAVYREMDIKDKHQNVEAVPMEVDRAKGFPKGKGKKGSKGKGFGKDGKSNGKGKSDGKSKGKSFDYGKGKNSKGFGKFDGKGKGGLAYDACKLCGQRGHWSKECPVRSLRQVAKEGETPAAGSPASGSGVHGGAQSSMAASTTVRRVQVINLDGEDEPDADQSSDSRGGL